MVSNCESEFKESSTLSCRGSTLVVENNQTELTLTSDNSVILAGTSSYSTMVSTLDNIVTGSDGDTQHEFRQPRDYFRQKYFEACDILIGELSDRFEQEDVMKPVLCMESILLKSACGEKCNSELKSFSESVFQADFSIPQLEKQLAILVDVIRVELPDVKWVTNIRTICTAMGSSLKSKHAF